MRFYPRDAHFELTPLCHSAHRPLIGFIPRIEHKPEVLTISSDSIQSASDSPARPKHLSEKAQGKQRAMSPIDQTPVAVRRVVQRPNAVAKILAPATTPAQEDDEEELLPLDQMLAKQRKQEEAKKFAEQKALAAAKAAQQVRSRRATTVLSDSDSDLEIEGAPAPVRSRAFGTPDFDRASTPRTLSKSERKIRALEPTYHHHQHEEDVTESQLADAGHAFGRDLMANHQVAAPRRRSKKGPRPSAPTAIDHETLSKSLLSKAKTNNATIAEKKRTAWVVKSNAEAEQKRLGVTAAAVDVKALMAKKEQAMKAAAEQEEQEEQEEDEDYQEEEEADAEDSDAAMASGSEAERPASSSQPAMVDDAAEEDSSAEGPAMDDDEDEEMPAPAVRGKKVRLQVDSEDEEDEPAPALAPAAAPVEANPSQFDILQEGGRRIVIPGLEDDEGGFSQFFDSQFSQDVGVVNDVS